jgi:hypothetical protein
MTKVLSLLPSAVQASKMLSSSASTWILPLVVRFALFPTTAYPDGAIIALVLGDTRVPPLPNLVSFNATGSFPELYTSNQRVELLVASMGVIMSSEIFKSFKAPFTTFTRLAKHHPEQNKHFKKRVIALLKCVCKGELE